jgi:hypothetical protein
MYSSVRSLVPVLFFAGAMLASGGFVVAGENPTPAPVPPRGTEPEPGSAHVQLQPRARDFAAPHRPDVSPDSASKIDELYRKLIEQTPDAAASPGPNVREPPARKKR